MQLITVNLIVLVLLLGCTSGANRWRHPTEPRIEHLQYHRWSGMSPGAGFTRTTLNAVEIDFTTNRFRRFDAIAKAPEPMLPWQVQEIARCLQGQEWQDLDDEQAAQLTAIVRRWLQTEPPTTYNQPRVLGREDGYAEELAATLSDGKHSLSTNPRSGFTPNDPLRPPLQWQALIDSLDSLGEPSGP